MSTPYLMRVEEGPERFAPLIEEARARGLKVGWLDLESAVTPPPDLESVAALGVLRAVSVSGGRTVSVKPLRGEPVLRDLIREHFRGCALVLVRGETDAPRLVSDGDAWTVQVAGLAARRLTTADLVAGLRRPNPSARSTSSPP
jgi:hypothetical protein